MISSISSAFADYDAYIEFMDVTEEGRVNLYLSNVEDASGVGTCNHNIVYLGYHPHEIGSSTPQYLYSAALTAMTAGKKVRLHSIDCTTKSLRVYK
ncbi:hypothetical protein MED121_05218 [Marinomonas sp. MED121]|uniref:hypothetical protein n=1 Tax=Marinomonas sp. MED121 TaxID=314277 RepID=UPI000068FBCD|nr:hypothetical protein [Marinomonas sp. MED121]EAQ63760.1 hypothetical protein MED121_05218 [Marinomonas sp. MED121]